MNKIINKQDHAYDMKTPRTNKRKIDSMMETLNCLKRESSNAKRREKRAKVTCAVLKAELNQANLITHELKMMLRNYDGMPL